MKHTHTNNTVDTIDMQVIRFLVPFGLNHLGKFNLFARVKYCSNVTEGQFVSTVVNNNSYTIDIQR